MFQAPVLNHSATALEALQKLGNDGNSIKIAVIDGAIEHNHPLLKHLSIEYTQAPTSHGTAVCSLIAGKSIGIAPQVEIISFPVFYEDVQGQIQGCSERTLAKAIKQARLAKCDIINISGASPSLNGLGSGELRTETRKCQLAGILIVAATGNDGQNTEVLPASLDTVLAIGACDEHGQPSTFNNYGAKLSKKTLLASGVNMPVAAPESTLSAMTGSSFATPVVTAISALLINALQLPRQHISTPEKLQKLLFESATPVYTTLGKSSPIAYSRLNIARLLKHLQPTIRNSKKRSNTMSDTQANPAQEVESTNQIAVEAQKSELLPATHNASQTSAETMASLTLPEINDPAANNPVHVAAAEVNPQTTVQAAEITPQSSLTDPRDIRSLEKIFAIGTIGYDFGSEARLDYFTQEMGNHKGHPFDPVQMAEHLHKDDYVEQCNALIWTLKIDGIPVYAIEPENQFAVLQYKRLVEFLHEQETKSVERVSIAGIISGETRLFNGHVIPRISPILRGMFNWKSADLAKLIMGDDKSDPSKHLFDFLNRVYYELRNRGADSHERALNYAATNAYQMKEVFEEAFNENLFLNKISAEPSPVSRPESDCWDVVLEFFNPQERLTAARKLYRYTVDVSDLMPVTIGTLRSWYAY